MFYCCCCCSSGHSQQPSTDQVRDEEMDTRESNHARFGVMASSRTSRRHQTGIRQKDCELCLVVGRVDRGRVADHAYNPRMRDRLFILGSRLCFSIVNELLACCSSCQYCCCCCFCFYWGGFTEAWSIEYLCNLILRLAGFVVWIMPWAGSYLMLSMSLPS